MKTSESIAAGISSAFLLKVLRIKIKLPSVFRSYNLNISTHRMIVKNCTKSWKILNYGWKKKICFFGEIFLRDVWKTRLQFFAVTFVVNLKMNE